GRILMIEGDVGHEGDLPRCGLRRGRRVAGLLPGDCKRKRRRLSKRGQRGAFPMRDVYVIGAFTTAFGRYHNRSYKDLTREAYLGALADAGMTTGDGIEFGYFTNCAMWVDGQACIRGQVCF